MATPPNRKMRFSGRKRAGGFDPRNPGVLVFFGSPGCGKTTLARDWVKMIDPKADAVFCATRNSHDQLTCLEPMFPRNYSEVTECVDEFLDLDPKRYPVFVLDDLDQYHVFLEEFIKQEAGSATFRDALGGFGAPHERAIEYTLKDVIRPIRDAGRSIIATCHVRPITWEDPLKGKTNKMEPTLSGRHQQLWIDEASAVWFLTHPYVEAKEMERTIKKTGATGMQLKIARKWFQDFFTGDTHDTLAEMEPQDRIVCFQPTFNWLAKTRTDGKDFPRVAPLPAPPGNTAESIFEFWEQLAGNGAGRKPATRKARRR